MIIISKKDLMKISFINIGKWSIVNTGLAYVISSLERTDHKPSLIDLAFIPKSYQLKYVLDKIREQRPDIIGFSVMTNDYSESLVIARKIKEVYPDIPLIWGRGSTPYTNARKNY